MRLMVTTFLLFVVCATLVAAQTPAPAPANATPAKEDISGMYSFLREGEFVQVTVEEGTVSGFISRYGDSESDKDSFLDQFFAKASLDGKQLTFTTKPVHGVWFEFAGMVERGTGKTPANEGYRLIKGKLTQHKTAGDKTDSKSREVEFKSFPQELEDTP